MTDAVPVPTNDLGRAFQEQRAELEDAALRVLRSGWYVHGPEHRAFEDELAEAVGVRHAIGVASGTDALALALIALTRGLGGEVVTAANAGGYATAAIQRAGATPRYVDVDADTLCLDTDLTLEAIGERTRAVVVTHLYGRLADVERLAAVCQERGVPLVEDVAQSIGAERGGRRAGAFGTVATFSFYPTKNLGAFGDGGAVVTDDGELAGSLRRLRQYGWQDKYVVVQPHGCNSRLDELQAALLRVRLPRVPAWNERRRAIISRYVEAAPAQLLHVLPAHEADHAGHLAVAVAADGQRDRVRDALARAGVATEVHYPVPDHLQPIAHASAGAPALPVTEHAAAHVLSLPCFAQLTDPEIEVVCGALSRL